MKNNLLIRTISFCAAVMPLSPLLLTGCNNDSDSSSEVSPGWEILNYQDDNGNKIDEQLVYGEVKGKSADNSDIIAVFTLSKFLDNDEIITDCVEFDIYDSNDKLIVNESDNEINYDITITDESGVSVSDEGFQPSKGETIYVFADDNENAVLNKMLDGGILSFTLDERDGDSEYTFTVDCSGVNEKFNAAHWILEKESS